MKPTPKKRPFVKLGPGGLTKRDLEFAIRSLLATKTHLGRAKLGLGRTDYLAVISIFRELKQLRERLRGIQGRVGRPERQLELKERAA